MQNGAVNWGLFCQKSISIYRSAFIDFISSHNISIILIFLQAKLMRYIFNFTELQSPRVIYLVLKYADSHITQS